MHLVLIDRMFVECNLALICAAAIGTVAIIFVVLDSTLNSGMGFEVITYPLTALLVCAFALVMELILSLVRNLKNRTFVERSFILRAVRWCWRTAGAHLSAGSIGLLQGGSGMASAAARGLLAQPVAQGVPGLQDPQCAAGIQPVYSAVLAVHRRCCSAWWRSDYWYMRNVG